MVGEADTRLWIFEAGDATIISGQDDPLSMTGPMTPARLDAATRLG